MVEILGQRIEAEILGDAVVAPGFGLTFETAEQELSRVLLVVGLLVGDEEDREIARQIGQGFGDDVEMLGGMERQ